ncbi:MAG: thioredoxin domain-containing protein [Ferruginibacter sp.]
MDHTFTNRLIDETSPYLKQHAHNPVEWFPWGPEALQKSKELDLPILASIGYSACHWCHVMENESFENEVVATFMNEHFINIKIDREERPDLDHIYMEAVQAIAGSGGWPLNVFLTPDQKPFYGGTYFPPQKAYNRPSWLEVLLGISDKWQNNRADVIKQADHLFEHMSTSANQLFHFISAEDKMEFVSSDCDIMVENILVKADKVNGGFGSAPKFPQTFTIQYLIMYGHFSKNGVSGEQGFLSLKKMLNGGIYDHLAGGMSRYSTDNEWLAPHFEKMLYDNALLVNVLCDAYQVTHDHVFKKRIEKTLYFLGAEMKNSEGGYYAAFDADSEGVEGKFYVWDKQEIEQLLHEDAPLYCDWYGITEQGNWERKNILAVQDNLESIVENHGITITEAEERINHANEVLLLTRKKRVHPAVDDKILLGWNALLITAYCKAFAALQTENYKSEAIELFDFIISRFKKPNGDFYHTYKNGIASHPAFLDDFAYLVQAGILLSEISTDPRFLREAKTITEYVLLHFSEEGGMFYFTNKYQQDVLMRKKEIYDGAVPSGNSILAENLMYLGLVYNKPEWKERAENMIWSLKEVMLKYPSSFAIWATLYLKATTGFQEIVVTGKNLMEVVPDILALYIPHKILQASSVPADFPLLKNKAFGEDATFYICKQYVCSAPVKSLEEFKKSLN